MRRSFFTLVAALAAALGMAGCTVHKQDAAPPLTGPSETAISLQISVSPDVLTQDGLSQSLVSVQAFGPNGQPQRSLALRAEIVVGGASTDFGSLSARNVVTDGSGRTSVTYTAPPPPVFNNDINTTVQIFFTPVGTDYSNANPKSANIRLVPPGVVGPPPSSLRPDFVVPGGVTIGNPVVFTASVLDPAGADARDQVVSFQWNFGDGDTGSGRSVSHVFDRIGQPPVTLTITDVLGRTQQTTHAVIVGQGALPVASFLMSPSGPGVSQTINFNASGSTAEAGHSIVDYSWNFGDGTSGSGAITTHSYPTAGSYTVTLRVTDDVGRVSPVVAQTIGVGENLPTAAFTLSPTTPVVGQNVGFNASQSKAAAGRTIASYAWDFGDGTSGAGVQTTHAYAVEGTYTVTLTVTDNAGQSAFATQTVTVGSDLPTASFTANPNPATKPAIGPATVFFDATGSTAKGGKTIVTYLWTFSEIGTTQSGRNTQHDYNTTGTFLVTLTVTDSGGKTATASQTIVVNPAP